MTLNMMIVSRIMMLVPCNLQLGLLRIASLLFRCLSTDAFCIIPTEEEPVQILRETRSLVEGCCQFAIPELSLLAENQDNYRPFNLERQPFDS